jgi:hypothetical protein
MTTSIDDILTQRGKTHGDYKDHASITQMLKQMMRRGKNWPTLYMTEQETLDMIAHKIGRILAGDPHFQDHWDDIAGYAKLVANEHQGKN